ncbi:unnamed protein product, partial [Closterium sp. NIES-53]
MGVTVCSTHMDFWLIAAYLPAQAGTRSSFLTICLTPFVWEQPVSAHLVLMGDLNLVEDPELDRSSRAGSRTEDLRLRNFWPMHDMRDAFRALHPSRREYTFYSKASQTSSQIDRALVSLSVLGELSEAKHVHVPESLSDHWFSVGFSVPLSLERGPRMWRLQAKQVNTKGVKAVTEKILRKLEGEQDCGLDKTLRLLSAGLRAHTREEKKRIRATIAHLEKEVEDLSHAVMQCPRNKRLQDRLVLQEAHLEAYIERDKERLQVMAGMNVEMNGEVPSPYLIAKVNIQKSCTLVQEVRHNRVMYRGTRKVLQAVEEHFGTAFRGVQPEEEVEWGAFALGPRFLEADAAELGRSWTEAEVKEAIASQPKGKSPGHDGLPAEFFAVHWDLLGGRVMQMVKDFERTGRVLECLATAVTVLLHTKGEKDQLGNYRPIALLNA